MLSIDPSQYDDPLEFVLDWARMTEGKEVLRGKKRETANATEFPQFNLGNSPSEVEAFLAPVKDVTAHQMFIRHGQEVIPVLPAAAMMDRLNSQFVCRSALVFEWINRLTRVPLLSSQGFSLCFRYEPFTAEPGAPYIPVLGGHRVPKVTCTVSGYRVEERYAEACQDTSPALYIHNFFSMIERFAHGDHSPLIAVAPEPGLDEILAVIILDMLYGEYTWPADLGSERGRAYALDAV